MSFLTALGYAAGGYGHARQQNVVDEQREQALQQQQADRERQLGIEAQSAHSLSAYRNQMAQQSAAKLKLARDQVLRSMGVDPTTGKAFVLPKSLQQIVPNNAGRVPLDPNTGKPYVGGASPDQVLAHRFALAQWLASTGQGPAAKIAATEADAQLRQEMQNEAIAREMAVLQNSNARFNAEQSRLDANSSDLQRYREQRLLLEEGRARRTGGATAQRALTLQNEANEAGSQWYEKWNAVTKPRVTSSGLPLPPLVAPGVAAAAGKLFSRVDNSANPIQTSRDLAAQVANPVIKSFLLSRGRAAAMRLQASQLGGSDGTPPFPGP